MNWLSSAIIAILFLSSYNFVLKITSSKISSIYGLPFIAVGVFVASLIGILSSKIFSLNNLTYSTQGVLFSIITGLLWGLGGIFFFLMFSKNVPLSVGLPLVTGGITIVGPILGILFLKEPITALKITGVAVTFLGFIILSRA